MPKRDGSGDVMAGTDGSHPCEDPRVRRVIVHLCEACIRGEGQECHTPGCVLFLHRVDLPFMEELLEDADAAEERWQRVSIVARQLAQALKGVSLYGSEDFPLYSWCDEDWTCEHPECIAGRDALWAWRNVDAPASAERSEDAP